MSKWVVILIIAAIIFMFIQAEMTFRRADKMKKEKLHKEEHE